MSGPDYRTQTRLFYDTVAPDYARLLPDTRFESPTDRATIAAFTEHVAGGDNALVLDAGCGTGRLTGLLIDAGLEVEGVDLSSGMIDIARERHPTVSFSVGTIDDLAWPDATFGGILAWYSIIHTPPSDVSRVLEEFGRVLSPGGWLLLGFQVGTGTRHLARAYGHDVDIDPYLFTANELADRGTIAGLIEHARTVRAPEAAEKYGQAQLLLRNPS